jgi:L-proline---[L-prolyl-carrier protein] ligase
MSAYLLQHLLLEAAQRTPEHPAVVDGARSLTYGELERRSARLANALCDLGVKPGQLVPLHTRKSIEAVVAIYGILRCGAGYVPVDFSNPAARLLDIVDQCRARCIITETAALTRLEEQQLAATPLRTAVTVDKTPPAAAQLTVLSFVDIIRSASPQHPAPRATDRDLAYVLFTSGSTGRPKGVMHTHQSALTFVRWSVDTFGINPADRLSNHAPFNFDLSVFDLFAAAQAGATVCLIPETIAAFPQRLAELLETQLISVWYSVPSVLARLAAHGSLEDRALERLRLVLFAGEVFPIKDLRALMLALPGRRYCNLYGPTETNVCTFHEVEEVPDPDDPPLPIGIPCANTQVVVLADDGSAIEAPGREGGLCVRGSSVMAGYLGRAEESEAALVESPFDEPRQDRFYRTGDRVRIDDRGRLCFIGRGDQMVKVGGYRVELGEVEAALSAQPDLLEAVAIPLPDEQLGTRIHAVVVPRHRGLSEEDLRRHCGRLLPRYMIPSAFELRDSLPRTSNDKVDRLRLAMEAAGAAAGARR